MINIKKMPTGPVLKQRVISNKPLRLNTHQQILTSHLFVGFDDDARQNSQLFYVDVNGDSSSKYDDHKILDQSSIFVKHSFTSSHASKVSTKRQATESQQLGPGYFNQTYNYFIIYTSEYSSTYNAEYNAKHR